MNSNEKAVLMIGGSIVAAAIVGVGLFLFTGFEAGIWFTVAGVPIIVVAGIAVYVRGVVSRGGTSERQYVTKRGRSTAEQFQAAVRDLRELERAYPAWEPTVTAQAESIAEDFRRQGVAVDLEGGSFDITGSVDDAEVQEFERLESEIETFRADYERGFEEFVETEFDRMHEARDRLEDAEIIDHGGRTPSPSNGTVAEYRDSLEEAQSEMERALTDAIKRVREMSRGETRPGDVNAVESELDAAAEKRDQQDYRSAVESVLEARDRLRDQLSGSFDAERRALSDLVDVALASGVDQHVDAEYIEELREADRSIDSLESSLDLDELMRYRTTVQRTCVDIVAAMEKELQESVRTLRGADLPSGYYTEPAVTSETFIDELSEIDDISMFLDRWDTAASRLVDALDTASTKSAVVEAYDDVAETIESEIRASGTVTESDLPVRHGTQFLGLYYRRNDGVEFDPEAGTLSRGDVERWDVSVNIAYERGGDSRIATVELDGSAYDETSNAETHVATSVDFTDVPAGRYTLRADPGDDTFGSVERELDVAGDTEVTVNFEERSLRERVCSDSEVDILGTLEEIGADLTDRFDAEGYVSSSMDLPVRSSHAPCLVATWAEENGREASMVGDDVIAYDRRLVERELENVVRYNLDPGDTLSFDDVRERFLSVPLPDSVLRDAISRVEADVDVRATNATITVE